MHTRFLCISWASGTVLGSSWGLPYKLDKGNKNCNIPTLAFAGSNSTCAVTESSQEIRSETNPKLLLCLSRVIISKCINFFLDAVTSLEDDFYRPWGDPRLSLHIYAIVWICPTSAFWAGSCKGKTWTAAFWWPSGKIPVVPLPWTLFLISAQTLP